MVMAEVLTEIFSIAIGIGMLWISYKREAVAWSFMAIVVFSWGWSYAPQVPFVVDAAGKVLPNAANKILLGINLLFGMFALIKTVNYIFERMNKKS